jgi:hypothetical protein
MTPDQLTKWHAELAKAKTFLGSNICFQNGVPGAATTGAHLRHKSAAKPPLLDPPRAH